MVNMIKAHTACPKTFSSSSDIESPSDNLNTHWTQNQVAYQHVKSFARPSDLPLSWMCSFEISGTRCGQCFARYNRPSLLRTTRSRPPGRNGLAAPTVSKAKPPMVAYQL